MGATSKAALANVETVKKYGELRIQKDTQATLALVTDDIEFSNERDGSFKGRKEFTEYLKKSKAEGTWDEPEVDGDDEQRVVVRGVVKVFFIPIKVVSTFLFTDEGLIRSIHTVRA